MRSEVLKVLTTRTAAGLAAAMGGLVALAVALHAYGLPADRLATAEDQLDFLVGWGAVLGALFASLLGALSFTAEVRHGTIRPTLVVTPRRARMVLAKAVAAAGGGAVLGLTGTATAVLAGRVVLAVRGLSWALGAADLALLLGGGAAAAALWGLLGLGVGTVVRNQVPAVVGILAWVLFVEGILVDTAPGVGRLSPGALGQAMSGLRPETLLVPVVAAGLLGAYGAAALAVAVVATNRQDAP